MWANQDIPWAIREVAESAVRAAAPHLRAAALNEAAAEAHELDEELLRRRDKCGHGRERAEGMAMGYEMAAYLVRKLEVGFRERAGREAT